MTCLSDYLQRSPLTATLNQDDAIYLAPHIPHGKLQGALASYIPAGTNPADILLLMDDTVFGSAKEGLTLSSTHIYCKQIMDSPCQFPLMNIKTIHYASGFLNGGLFINNQCVASLTQLSNHSLKLFAQLVSGYITEQASMQVSKTTSTGIGHAPQSNQHSFTAQDPFAKPDPFANGSPLNHQLDAFAQTLPLVDLLVFFSLYRDRQWNTASVRYIRHCFRDLPPAYQTKLEERMKQSPYHLNSTLEQLGRMLSTISIDSRKQLLQWVIQLMLINGFSEQEFDHYMYLLEIHLQLSRQDMNWVIENTTLTCATDWQ